MARRKTSIVKSLTNFKGMQGDAVKVASILAGMLVGKVANDNVKALIAKAPTDGVTNGIGRVFGNAGKSVTDTLIGIAPAAVLTLGGFVLRRQMKHELVKDAALGMMGYGLASGVNSAFKFNVMGQLQGFGRAKLGSLYPYVDRPRKLNPTDARVTTQATPAAAPQRMSGGFSGTMKRAV